MAHRYHVGESLIPSIRHYMRYIDADEKLVNHGFVHKVSNLCNETVVSPYRFSSSHSLVRQLNLLNSRRKDVRLPWFLIKLRNLKFIFKIPILCLYHQTIMPGMLYVLNHAVSDANLTVLISSSSSLDRFARSSMNSSSTMHEPQVLEWPKTLVSSLYPFPQ